MKFRASPMLLLGIAVLMLCSACKLGGGSSNDQKYGYVRLVNAINQSSAPSINLTIDSSNDDDYAISSVAAGSASDYSRVKVNGYSLVVSATGSSLTASSTASLSVSDDGESDKDYHYSVVAYQRGGVIKFATIQESETDPNSGFANITAINAGSDAGTVDVYIVAPGTSLSNLSPVFGALSSSSTSQSQSMSTGTYDVIVTAKDQQSDVRLTIKNVALTEKGIFTLVLTPTPGGALLDGVLVKNQGGATMSPNSNARVRIAAAFATNQPVVATDTSSSSTISVTSPSVGSYSLVPAADTMDVTVNGVNTASDLPFSAGRDYTILAYNPTTPNVTLIEDNNQLPSSGAKIRLINAAVSTAGVTLKNSSTTIFSQILYGQASDYSGISSGSATLRLSSLAANFLVDTHDWGDTDTSYTTSITSGNVYTLFLLGTTDKVIATLNGDRTNR